MADSEPNEPLPYRRPERTRGGFADKMGNLLRSWARETFSRDQLISSLKSFLWVAPLTILIWVYAEREQIARVPQQIIPVGIKSTDPNLLVTLIEPSDKNLMAEVSGPRVQVDKVQELLKPKNDQPSVWIEVSHSEYPPGGPYTMPSSYAGEVDIFRKNGVTVANFSPFNLRFSVDRIVTRELDITVPADVQNLVGTPAFEPRKVTISAPQTLLEIAESRGQLKVTADLTSFKELRTPGKHSLQNVPMVVRLGDSRDLRNVSITPTAVNVMIEVRQQDVEFKINAMPVYVTYPPGMDDRYRAAYDATVANVTIFGPSEQIEALQRPEFEPKPKAILEINRTHLPVGEPRTSRLKFELPPGIRVSPTDEKRTIDFRLMNRTAPE